MLILYFVSYSKVKLAEEDDPSELTDSVERGVSRPPISVLPPINKVEPFSPSTSQHKWPCLFFLSLTEVGVKSPVRGFNIRQDRSVEDVSRPPPHRRWPHWLCPKLPSYSSPGRSGRRQVFLVLILKTSTFRLGRWSWDLPPVIMTPGRKYIH